MGTSRRDFIKKGTIVALAAGVPVSVSAKAAREAWTARDLSAGATGPTLQKSVFESQLNSTFVIKKGVAEFPVSLVAVTDLHRYEGIPADREGFTLSFRGQRGKALRQDTYLIEHKKLGAFSLLLVPSMTKAKTGTQYEAVINHLHP